MLPSSEKKTNEVYMYMDCICKRHANVRLLYVLFMSDVNRHIGLIIPYYLILFFFWYGCFLVNSYNILRANSYRTLVCDIFHKFNWEKFHSNYSIVTACNIRNQSSRKEMFDKKPVVAFLRNDRSVRHIFPTIFISLSVTKVLKKYRRRSSSLAKLETEGLHCY